MSVSGHIGAVALLLLASGCGGSGSGAQSAGDVNCPEGQTFDGEYCQVDQNVATAEQPAPPEPRDDEVPVQPVEPGDGDEDEPQSDEGEPAEEEGDDAGGEDGEKDAPPTAEEATPVDVTMAAQAGPLIQYLAGSHLPGGARPLGAPFAGQFAEGQILERKVQLTAGKCYTVVAAALPPVVEIDIELREESKNKLVAKDDMSGLQAVLGSRDECFQPPRSTSYRLVLTVKKGQGIAAAQAFAK